MEIEQILSNLNEQQKEAVLTTEGYVASSPERAAVKRGL